MQLPTIHRNGTSADSLTEDLCDAMTALLDAIKAVEQCAPNMRDYYLGEGADYTVACAEHAERLKQIVAVRRELNTIAEHAAGLD